MLESATEKYEGCAPLRHPDDQYAPHAPFDISSSSSALSGPGNGDQHFAHLQPITHTNLARAEFGKGIIVFWRRIIDNPEAFPPESWKSFLYSIVTAPKE